MLEVLCAWTSAARHEQSAYQYPKKNKMNHNMFVWILSGNDINFSTLFNTNIRRYIAAVGTKCYITM